MLEVCAEDHQLAPGFEIQELNVAESKISAGDLFVLAAHHGKRHPVGRKSSRDCEERLPLFTLSL